MSNFTQMKTDELSRNRADRNIGITELGCILEFLGNSYGDKIFICFTGRKLIIFSNDNGFTENDKKAIRMKNKTGKINSGASLNGVGVKLAIDRMIKKTKDIHGTEGGKYPATIFSVNEREKKYLNMACFQVSEWLNMTAEQIEEYYELIEENLGNSNADNINGSMWQIPLNFTFREYIKDNWSEIKNNILRFMNRRIYNKDISIYMKRTDDPDSLAELTPLEVSILNCPENESYTEFDLKIYQSNPDIVNSQGNRYIAFIISNVKGELLSEEKKIIIEEFPNEIVITKQDFHYKDLEDMEAFERVNYEIIDEVKVRCTVLSKEELKEQTVVYTKNKGTDLAGLAVYVNGLYINEKAIQRHLGGKTLGNFGNTAYGGNPRFEVECSKETKCFKLPSDKVNVVETGLGIKLMKLIKIWNERLHRPKNTEKLTIPWQRKAYVKHRWNKGKYTGLCATCDKKMYLDNPNHFKLALYKTNIQREDLFQFSNIIPLCKSCEKVKTPGRSIYEYIETISEGQRDLFRGKYEYYISQQNEYHLEEDGIN